MIFKSELVKFGNKKEICEPISIRILAGEKISSTLKKSLKNINKANDLVEYLNQVRTCNLGVINNA